MLSFLNKLLELLNSSLLRSGGRAAASGGLERGGFLQELWIELQERIEIDRCDQMGRAFDDLAGVGCDEGEAGMDLSNPRHWEDL